MVEASRSWRYGTDDAGFAELNPGTTLAAVDDAVREVVSAADAGDVAGIGVTSQRTGVVLLDAGGLELSMGPNADGRGAAEGIALERAHGDLVWRTSGRLPVMLYLPARLAWFRANRPDLAGRARSALAFSDWVVHRLTGVHATDPTQAAEMLVYDLASGAWSAELCEALGVPPSLLPEILPAGTAAGRLTAESASRLGLRAGIPVACAGADTQCAAVGLGALAPGEAVVVAGTTMLAGRLVEAARPDGGRRLWASPFPAGGGVMEAHCGEAGAPIDWFCGLAGESPAWLDRAAAGATPGAGGVTFVDPFPSEMGDFALVRTGALSFPAPLIALARPREDVARALVEGIAFAACAGLEWTSEAEGAPASVALAGGLTRIETFARVMATALGRAVRAAGPASASARGAAILASVAAGLHGSVREAARAMADPGREVEPVEEWREATSGAFANWRERAARVAEGALRVSHLMGGS